MVNAQGMVTWWRFVVHGEADFLSEYELLKDSN